MEHIKQDYLAMVHVQPATGQELLHGQATLAIAVELFFRSIVQSPQDCMQTAMKRLGIQDLQGTHISAIPLNVLDLITARTDDTSRRALCLASRGMRNSVERVRYAELQQIAQFGAPDEAEIDAGCDALADVLDFQSREEIKRMLTLGASEKTLLQLIREHAPAGMPVNPLLLRAMLRMLLSDGFQSLVATGNTINGLLDKAKQDVATWPQELCELITAIADDSLLPDQHDAMASCFKLGIQLSVSNLIHTGSKQTSGADLDALVALHRFMETASLKQLSQVFMVLKCVELCKRSLSTFRASDIRSILDELSVRSEATRRLVKSTGLYQTPAWATANSAERFFIESAVKIAGVALLLAPKLKLEE